MKFEEGHVLRARGGRERVREGDDGEGRVEGEGPRRGMAAAARGWSGDAAVCRCRRGSAYGRVSCAYQSRVQSTSAGTQEEAKTGHSPRNGGFRHTGQNRPTPDPGTGARLVALGGGCTVGWRAKRGFNPTRVGAKSARESGERRERKREGERERNRGRGEAREEEAEDRVGRSGVSDEGGVGGKAGERRGLTAAVLGWCR